MTSSVIYRTIAGSAVIAVALLAPGQPSRAAKTGLRPFSVTAIVRPSSTISLSTNVLTWTAKDTLVRISLAGSSTPSGSASNGSAPPGNKTYVPADNGPITVTGGIRTSPRGGAGSIVLLAPGDIAGSAHASHVLPINDFALTCSGSGNTGTLPAYAAPLTPLQAHAFAPCATWGAAANAHLNFSMNVLLILSGTPPDTYTSGGFTVVATTT